MQKGNSPAHGFNRYAYANNNPYKYTDPDGEFAIVAAIPWAYAAIKSALFVGSAGAVAYGASEAINVYNESSEGGEDWEADYEDWANGNGDDVTDHGEEMEGRGVDKETTRENGEKFRDTQSGGTVYVDGPNVVRGQYHILGRSNRARNH